MPVFVASEGVDSRAAEYATCEGVAQFGEIVGRAEVEAFDALNEGLDGLILIGEVQSVVGHVGRREE
jgi:hypothetical protein